MPRAAKPRYLGAMKLSASQLAGQALVVGFDGAALPEWVRTALSEGRLGGVILFRRNLPELAAIAALNAAVVAAAAGPPPLIGLDEEGGRVRRMPAPFPALPAMRRLGDTEDQALARRVGRGLGAALGAFGFNLDFAPVLDVDTNPSNPIIGDRAFSSEPERAGALGAAFGLGLMEAGVLACGKHFPGHGDTVSDSHLELPRVDHGRERLERVELAPFAAAIRAGLPALMSAHVVYPALDPARPATLSRAIATDLLRDRLGFGGVLFSDDLEMRALADHHAVEESAVLAVEAGCDVLLVCSRRDFVERAHEALAREAERSPAFHARLRQAFERSRVLRESHPPRPSADPTSPLAVLAALAASLHAD